MSNDNFTSQAENLVDKGYPEAAGLTAREFLELLRPLKRKLSSLDLPDVDIQGGRLPFLIVIKSDMVPVDKMMQLVEREGKQGMVNMKPVLSEDFRPIKQVIIPDSSAYLLVDIDRGRDTLNIPPDIAIEIIESEQRSPLTIDEGIAVITQYPGFLKKNNCFSLLASRRGDRRVPALWLSEQRPKLGWCFAGVPHTWLGSISCKSRVGI